MLATSRLAPSADRSRIIQVITTDALLDRIVPESVVRRRAYFLRSFIGDASRVKFAIFVPGMTILIRGIENATIKRSGAARFKSWINGATDQNKAGSGRTGHFSVSLIQKDQ